MPRYSLRPLTVCVLAIVLLFSIAGAAEACPNCKQLLAEPDNAATATPDAGDAASTGAPGTGSNVGAGFYYSILFMLGMPLLVAGGLGTMLYVAARKAPGAARLVQ